MATRVTFPGRIKGYLAAGLAVALCPCHLLMWSAVAGGSALGMLLAEHTTFALLLAGAASGAGLLLAIHWLSPQEVIKVCEVAPLTVPPAAGRVHG